MGIVTDLREQWASCVYSNFDEQEVLACEDALALRAEAVGDEAFARFLRANALRRRARALGTAEPGALKQILEVGHAEAEEDPALAAIALRTFACALRYHDGWGALAGADNRDPAETQRSIFESARDLALNATGDDSWVRKEALASVHCALFNERVGSGLPARAMLEEAAELISTFSDYLPTYFDRANHARRLMNAGADLELDEVVQLYRATIDRATALRSAGESSVRVNLWSSADRSAVRYGVTLATEQLEAVLGSATRGLAEQDSSVDALDRDRFAASR